MHKVYIGLGSNLDNPQSQLKQALELLDAADDIHVRSVSSFYTSKPVGPQDQPDFINGAALIETSLSANELLIRLQEIENKQGRIKKRHWGERIIDLDILLYDDLQLSSPELTIPHKELPNRDFVLIPLLDLASGLRLPDNTPIKSLLEQCPDNQLTRI